jgi:hypothetical protein
MAKTTLSVLFKKQQRDDKKEVLKFEFKGSDDANDNEKPIPDSLFLLAGELVIIELPNTEIGPISAEFAKLNKDSKKTTLDFNLKGDSEAKALQTYQYAGQHVTLSVEPAQADLTEQVKEEKDDHEGIEYTTDLSGVVNIQSKLEKAPDKAETPAEAEEETEAELEDDLPF